MMREMRPKVPKEIANLGIHLNDHGDKNDLIESRKAFTEKRAPVFKKD